MNEKEYAKTVNWCRNHDCPNYCGKDRWGVHLLCCNYQDSCNPTWLGEVDYCGRFDWGIYTEG